MRECKNVCMHVYMYVYMYTALNNTWYNGCDTNRTKRPHKELFSFVSSQWRPLNCIANINETLASPPPHSFESDRQRKVEIIRN